MNNQTVLAARADLFLVVAELLRGPPPPSDLDGVGAAMAALPALCAAAALGDAGVEALAAESMSAWERSPREVWLAEHATLFESSMQCPPNECAYIRRDKGQVMADIAGFYKAFGRELDARHGERLDHVACELEFVSTLFVMQALATREGDVDGRDVAAQGLRLFVHDHPGEWLPDFCIRLQAAAVLPLHHWLACFLAALWQSCCRDEGWPDPAAREVRPPIREDEPDVCCGATCPPA